MTKSFDSGQVLRSSAKHARAGRAPNAISRMLGTKTTLEVLEGKITICERSQTHENRQNRAPAAYQYEIDARRRGNADWVSSY